MTDVKGPQFLAIIIWLACCTNCTVVLGTSNFENDQSQNDIFEISINSDDLIAPEKQHDDYSLDVVSICPCDLNIVSIFHVLPACHLIFIFTFVSLKW